MLSSLVSLFSGMTVLCCFLSKLKIIVSHIQPSFLVVYGELASLVLINPSWLELENFQAIFLLYFCFPNVLNFYVVRFNYSPIQFVPFKCFKKTFPYPDHTSKLFRPYFYTIVFKQLENFVLHAQVFNSYRILFSLFGTIQRSKVIFFRQRVDYPQIRP